MIAPFDNISLLARYGFPNGQSSLSAFLSDESSGGTVTAYPDKIELSTGTTTGNMARLQSVNVDLSKADAVAVGAVVSCGSVPSNSHIGLFASASNQAVKKISERAAPSGDVNIIRDGTETTTSGRVAAPTAPQPISVIADLKAGESYTFTTNALGAQEETTPNISETGIDVFLKTEDGVDYTMTIHDLAVESYRMR